MYTYILYMFYIVYFDIYDTVSIIIVAKINTLLLIFRLEGGEIYLEMKNVSGYVQAMIWQRQYC